MVPQAQQLDGEPRRLFEILFEKTGSMFIVMESCCGSLAPGGYRASMWNFNRQQSIDLVSHSDLDLNSNCLGISLLPQQV